MQKYFKDNIVEFKADRSEYSNIRCVGVIIDVKQDDDDKFYYWIQCPNSAHKIDQNSIIARYIDMESGNY